ncbi:hypothetical protein HanOQP8_Chr17g0666561 [Helianthus annuus]|nr:hypothetical protein HanIR_Chr17g0880471 [Helianthus annuus]KAJ0448140.1 hypothetical protein HanHA89_Chr17g0713391 [Helianthus annuus]KAJ0633025.1 hypothetical protein HanLR1_Chr17g0671881 [Helianthus annuus]KAJ0636828.1 hypothetical protein HanOQP8_Chr17g0666561 [Helianthus annuus]
MVVRRQRQRQERKRDETEREEDEREEERAMRERKRWSAQPSTATEPVTVVHGGSGTSNDTSFSVSPMWFRQIDDVAEMVEVFHFDSGSGLIRLGVVHFRSVFGSCFGNSSELVWIRVRVLDSAGSGVSVRFGSTFGSRSNSVKPGQSWSKIVKISSVVAVRVTAQSRDDSGFISGVSRFVVQVDSVKPSQLSSTRSDSGQQVS